LAGAGSSAAGTLGAMIKGDFNALDAMVHEQLFV
jgi:hypothetical protein